MQKIQIFTNLQKHEKNVKSTKSTKNWTQSLDAAIALVY